ncbi:MAG: TadE/TadG family type IV pilus assembly protein [Chloroflexota bacterium]|nr:pilus assembly protein [Chloroflexota bacterium]
MKLQPNWQKLNCKLSRIARGGASGLAPNRPLRPVTAQALVEFMLVSIPLLATMFAIFEFGMAFWDLEQVSQVTREAARETAACANQCDDQVKRTTTSDTAYYKDLRALQAIINKNQILGPDNITYVDYSNGTRLNPANIDYILIRRVADAEAFSGMDYFKLNTANGSLDISTQYQMYVPYLINGQVPANRFIPFQDATVSQTIQIGLPDPTKSTDGTNATLPFFNSNYLSSPCINIVATGAISYTDSTKFSKGAVGMNFTCRYNDTTAHKSDPVYNWSRGRPVCQPADRFYVEVAYRHYWVAPFFPEVGVSVSRPKGPNENGFIVIKQRSYLKVEPRFFPVGDGGICPTGIN